MIPANCFYSQDVPPALEASQDPNVCPHRIWGVHVH